MTPADTPRVLLVSNESPHTGGAGAIIFQRLFGDYPAACLRVVTNALPPPGAERLPCTYRHLPLAVDRLNRTRFWKWRAILRALGGARWLPLGRLDAAARDFQPDLVATLLQDSWYYELAARYARRLRRPLVVFVHDLPHGFEPVPAALRAPQQRRDAAVFRQAAARLCVSVGMQEFFRRDYGCESDVLIPPRSGAPVHQTPDACATLRNPERLTLGYAGGLHYGYGEQLLRLLPVFRETGVRVEMFGPAPAGNVAALAGATDVFTFHGRLAPEVAWEQLRRRADVVLQPYLNPPGPHELQYRTHFPSKLGDALSLGLPLLITGPDYASGVRWCREHPGCAEIVTAPEPAALRAALTRLREQPALRVALATAAQHVALEFALPPLRHQLHDTLGTLAAASSRQTPDTR